MTVAAAITIDVANRTRCATGLCPCLFRRTGFDQKKTLVVHAVVLLSHPLDHLVSDINRIKRHIALVPPGELTLRVFAQATLTHQQLLSTIEQFEKELLAKTPGTPSVRAWVRTGKGRQQSAVFSLASNKFFQNGPILDSQTS